MITAITLAQRNAPLGSKALQGRTENQRGCGLLREFGAGCQQ
jgi:hypothetical protein